MLRGETEHMPANVSVEPDLDKAIEGADVVMALRIQKERAAAGLLPSMREYTRRWMVSEARLAKAKPNALVMHPGPMNEGVEIASSIAHSPRAQIEEQVTNGVAMRMAVLYQTLTGRHGGEI
jgi:aspartate carbamoyltransferase catalytic subunit